MEKRKYLKVKNKITLIFKRFYVITFNIYAWFWLYRQIFIRQSTDFESYLLWFFMTFGVYVFVLEHQELFLNPKKKKSDNPMRNS